MHPVAGGEDAVDVGVDVEGGERDVLASTPKDLPEEEVGVETVGEVGDQRSRRTTRVGSVLFNMEHDRGARWEVGVAGLEKELGKLSRSPPP